MEGLPTGRARSAHRGGAGLRAGRGRGPHRVRRAARPDLRTRLPAEGIAIVMALDVSGSMATSDIAVDAGRPADPRLEAAKRAFRLFVAGGDAADGTPLRAAQRRPGGARRASPAVPTTACPLTLNHSVLLRMLEDQKPKDGADAGTNIGDAVAEAVIRLEAAGPRPKVLVLLSDGEHNVFRDGPDAPLMPRQAAQLAAALGVKVYTIDAGGEPSAAATPDEVQQRAGGREVLKAVAAMTGGRAFAAAGGADLLAACREIDALEKRPVESFQYRRYFEYYPWFAAAAVVLSGVAFVLDRTCWLRLP